MASNNLPRRIIKVKIHKLLLKSKFQTLDKDEAGLFFVPSYVKCLRMIGGLNDKEINQTHGCRLDLLLYRLLQKAYSSVMAIVMGEEVAERRKQKTVAAQATTLKVSGVRMLTGEHNLTSSHDGCVKMNLKSRRTVEVVGRDRENSGNPI
ncbi:hypothetical protein IFM89_030261 [Coptis chinensis]|uniref:Uncharacterized protein n=1 Tax=Coptis chinensis TaxID=261450 RepID=A0A835HZ00_9MAGN|nr:hypothetical protein IFM89_030261 [Coptis chinensis]